MGFVILAIIGIAFIVIITNISVVQQSRAYVIERLGAFHSVWGVGMHFKFPFIDRIARRVSLKEQVLDYPPQPVITKDNVTMQIDTVVYFQITDPKLYAYGVEQPMAAMETLTATTLRNIIGDLELDQTLTSRDVVNTKMRAILDEATDPWGIKVNRVELKNILPPQDIQNSMEKQMKAERDRRQAILQAEGQKKSAILIAEGEKESAILRADAEKQAAILKAEGEAEAIRKVQQALLMDGAMPWGTDTSEVHSIDGFLMARRLHEQHFTSLSLEHNYREAGYFADFAMKKWQKQRLTPRMLKNMGLHYAPDWFCNEFGKAVPRSLFDYIRDHLGYLVGIRSGSVRRENDSLRVCGSLMNYGFAAPLGMERLELVLFGPGKRILESHQLCTMMDLQPGHAVDFDVMFPGAGVAVRPGGGFGIRFVNSAGTPARLVNDLPFEAGMNVLLLF